MNIVPHSKFDTNVKRVLSSRPERLYTVTYKDIHIPIRDIRIDISILLLWSWRLPSDNDVNHNVNNSMSLNVDHLETKYCPKKEENQLIH